MDSHPFLFWGHSPTDWFEGANEGHIYEVRFVNPPDGSARKAVARELTVALRAGSAVLGSTPLQWSGAWMLVFFGERRAGTARAAFAQVAEALAKVHRVVPIAEVVMLSARAPGASPWDQYTEATARRPKPGPPWRGLVFLGHYSTRNTKLNAGSPDSAAEEARTAKARRR